MAERVDHVHGDTGTQPSQSLNFQDGDYPDPEEFDWFWSEVPDAINDHADLLEAIDSDEDGIVDQADNALLFKGNDLDSDGDGVVDDSDQLGGNSPDHYELDIDQDGVSVTDAIEALDFLGFITATDQGNGTVSIDPSHDHDSRYILEGGDTMTGTLTIDSSTGVLRLPNSFN